MRLSRANEITSKIRSIRRKYRRLARELSIFANSKYIQSRVDDGKVAVCDEILVAIESMKVTRKEKKNGA